MARRASSRVVFLMRRISAAIGWRRVCTTCFSGCYWMIFEITGLGCSCDRRLTVVLGRALLRLGMGLLFMLRLSSDRRDMSLLRSSFLFRRGPRRNTSLAAVVADVAYRIHFNRGVINIVNFGNIHIAHGTIVKEMSVVPTAAFKAHTEIPESVIDPAVEPYFWAPIPVIEEKSATSPSPV